MFVTIFLIASIFCIYLWLFYISIYEVKIHLSKDELFAGKDSSLEIKISAINSMGSKALFRSEQGQLIVDNGNELVSIISSQQNDFFKIISRGKSGQVTLKLVTEHSLFPTKIKIPILNSKSK